jgi:DNA-binding transcriptional ArsR family regulator
VTTYQETQLDALGDPTRRAILARLIDGPLPVGELARDFPVSRPAISQHLRVLKEAQLVVDRPAGNRRLYQLNPAGFETLREYLEQFWGQALSAFKREVEKPVAQEAREKKARKHNKRNSPNKSNSHDKHNNHDKPNEHNEEEQ